MPTVPSILADLKKSGSEQTRKTYIRHGIPAERTLGASVAQMKIVAKSIKGQQALACDLYDTGILEAMYLAGLVADGAQMSAKQLNSWAQGTAGMGMISEYAVPWVTVENAHANELANKWVQAKQAHVASTGWCTYSGLAATRSDENLDLAEIEHLLSTVVRNINGAQNRVRYTMNGFVISVGTYVQPLLKQAKAAAKAIGTVSVDMGDTACKLPPAFTSIEKMEAAGKLGKKRKTIRC